MSTPHNPSQNHLLAALPTEEFGRLAAHLELVPMRLGDTLYRQRRYVPCPGIIGRIHGVSVGLA